MRAREIITEIDYAAKLVSSNYPTDNLLKIGVVIGQIQNHDVMQVSSGAETAYSLVVDGKVAAFLGFEQEYLKNIKNFTKEPGVIRALIGYLVHKAGKTIKISADEGLTSDGIKWLMHLINSPRGLKIQDQTGSPANIAVLKREWNNAKQTGIPGPTSITISENSEFGQKLRLNEARRRKPSLLMHVNVYEIPDKQDISEDDDYRIQHRPADKTSGSPMHDLSGVYPDDIYGPNGAQYYGHYGQNNPLDIAAIQKIRIARGNPKKGIQIYRAVPAGVKSIQPGDWVTTVKAYAQEHGAWIGPKFKIISRVVNAGDLYTEGNSILEWGWDP